MKRTSITLLALLITATAIWAQKKNYSVEDLWKNFTFRTKGISDIRSMNDGIHFTVLDDNRIVRYVYETGKIRDTLLDGRTLTEAGSDGVSVAEYAFSADEQRVLIGTDLRPIYRHSTEGFFFVYERTSKKLTPLSDQTLGRQRLAEFSPDARKVAFVRNNNLFIVDLVSGQETAVTSDGRENEIINGTCDWVYEEEFGFTKGFQWSPSGRYLAYYRFDESAVKEFTLTYHGPLYPREVRYKYPKAGEDNSLVTIHAYDLQTARVQNMDIGSETDQYIPRIKWTTSDQTLAILRLNRLQNHLEILFTNPATGTSALFYEEKNKYYVDITDNLWFLKDQMIFTSEKSGYNHIHVKALKDGKEMQLTTGAFDVIEVMGIDEKNQLCYYSAGKSSPINVGLYAARLDGKREQVINEKPGTNGATFSTTFDYYIHRWSDANTPPRYAIVNRKGAEVVVLEDNQALKTRLSEYNVPDIEFSTLTTTDNIELHYWIMKPADFDPKRSYPLLMYVYGGPGSQTVANAWSYQNLWFRHLTQLGYVVVSVDNRGTGHRGEEFKKCTYLNLGKLETEDQIEAAKYFGKLSWIDAARIGIWGWSYGGYMSTLCMTKGAEYFKTGIAVAPVTNWRYYDNIYTERFMRTPQENGENYDHNSPIHHVKKLKGNYLLIHGLTDDNVHAQNAYDLVTALVAADKDFQMFIYPNRNHGIFGGNTRNHLFRMMTDYILENL